MRADTKSISIEADPRTVFEFVADPAHLPRWAVGFAKAVRKDGDRWLVGTGAGELPVRVRADPATGVVDFLMSPAPGVEVAASSRVVARGAGSEYVFTQVQAPGMPEEAFARSVAALVHELTVLKALLEVDCPG
jgi:polyketide cyclase/dehydrase/lipid transport protein